MEDGMRDYAFENREEEEALLERLRVTQQHMLGRDPKDASSLSYQERQNRAQYLYYGLRGIMRIMETFPGSPLEDRDWEATARYIASGSPDRVFISKVAGAMVRYGRRNFLVGSGQSVDEANAPTDEDALLGLLVVLCVEFPTQADPTQIRGTYDWLISQFA